MKYIFSLGSNMGDRCRYVRSGVEFLSGLGRLVSKSSLYETSPVGMGKSVRSFYNSVIILESDTSPEEMLRKIKLFEKESGRDPEFSHMRPRQIDIDILFIGNRLIDMEKLKVPHKEIGNRRFILEPLNEILPGFIHPLLKIPVSEMLAKLDSKDQVRKIPAQEDSDY